MRGGGPGGCRSTGSFGAVPDATGIVVHGGAGSTATNATGARRLTLGAVRCFAAVTAGVWNAGDGFRRDRDLGVAGVLARRGGGSGGAQHLAQRDRERRGRDAEAEREDEQAARHLIFRSRGSSDPRQDPQYSETRRRRSALPITDTELRLIAAAAIIGLSSRPNTG